MLQYPYLDVASRGEVVSVLDFGARVDDETFDSSEAIQRALDTGKNVLFPDGWYYANNLETSADSQVLFAYGRAFIVKNADGDLLTNAFDDVSLQNLVFRGDASTPVYTGDNISSTGTAFRAVNCGSVWAYGRALKSTGGNTRVYGTNGLWQTASDAADGYDIEIGESGVQTLYHQLLNIYTSSAEGGVLFINAGTSSLIGSQIGKLTLTEGAGSFFVGNRIIGLTNITSSSALFTSNAFAADITINAGSAGIAIDTSNAFQSGVVITNNGNGASPIQRQVSSGGIQTIRYGDAVSSLDVTYYGATNTSGRQFIINGSYVVPNNAGLKARNFADTADINLVGLGASNNSTTVGNDSGFTFINSSAGGINLGVSGTSVVDITATKMAPRANNTVDLGDSTHIYDDGFIAKIRPGEGTATWTSGAGTPEGSVTAVVGSLFTRTDGGANTTLYIKETGSGNTGWVAK